MWEKLFGSTAKEIIRGAGGIVDELVASDEEKAKAKERLSKLVFGTLTTVTALRAKVIAAETNGNWLQRSTRPIISFTFTALVVYCFVAGKAIPSQMWELCEWTIGGHFITRGVQHIAQKVTQNMDLSLLRKKDRKEHYEHEKEEYAPTGANRW